jgi:PKD repeat protein
VNPSNRNVVWNDTSYDPDRWLSPTNYSTEETGIDYAATRGILERKYFYITPSGQTVEQKLVTPTETGIYTVGLSVKDEYGAWSHWAVQTIKITAPATPDKPPVAGFTVTPTAGYRGTAFAITSTAYDPEDGPAANLQHAYFIRNVTAWTPETLQSNSRSTWTKMFNSLGVMEIRQVVTDSKGQTAQAIRTVTVANRKPVARFEWSPQTVWEGDLVAFQNTSVDPDGDPLTHAWQIRNGNGTLVHTSGSLHTAFRFREPGTYTVTLHVSDGVEDDQSTQVILVSPLTLKADIFHTPEWLAYHQERGHRTTEAPKQFYAGERMLLQARHAAAPYEQIIARLNATGRDGKPLRLETILAPSDTPGLAVGELADERLQSLEKGLPTGIHQVVFFIRYANEVEKTVTVPFEIIGHVLGTVQVHRVR